MLPSIRENLDGLTEEEQNHYTEQDGKFHLQVDPVNGIALEDVGGLKKTVEKLRGNETQLQKDLKASQENFVALETKYEGIDPDEARDAIQKFDEVKDWDGDTKIKEAVGASERKAESSRQELVKVHKKEVEILQDELADVELQLTEAIIHTRIVEALQKEEGSVELLLPHVKKHVRMVKNSTGKRVSEVVNDSDEPRVGDSAGNPMTITQYVQEMKINKTFAAAFSGANSTGSGGSNSPDGGQPPKADETKTVAASDGKALSSNIEDIATGKTNVDMAK